MTDDKFLRINPRISIPRSEIQFTFVRSSGPGGQNVNKVSSKAVLRWSAKDSVSLPQSVLGRLLAQCGRQINDRGELVLSSQRYRDQSRNVADCLEKLRVLVAEAAVIPKKRKRTRVPKSAREARLKQKRATGEKKQMRRPDRRDD
jgi:ribosome-associated protein